MLRWWDGAMERGSSGGAVEMKKKLAATHYVHTMSNLIGNLWIFVCNCYFALGSLFAIIINMESKWSRNGRNGEWKKEETIYMNFVYVDFGFWRAFPWNCIYLYRLDLYLVARSFRWRRRWRRCQQQKRPYRWNILRIFLWGFNNGVLNAEWSERSSSSRARSQCAYTLRTERKIRVRSAHCALNTDRCFSFCRLIYLI